MRGLATVVLLAALVTGCGVPVDSQPSALSADSLPSGLSPSTPTPVTDEVPTGIDVDLFLINQDNRLQVIQRNVTLPVNTLEVLETLIAAGEDPEAIETGQLRSAIPSTTTVIDAETIDGILVINLGDLGFAEIDVPEQRLQAVAQFVYTVTNLESVDAVVFEINGEQRPVPTDTESTDRPVNRQDYASLG